MRTTTAVIKMIAESGTYGFVKAMDGSEAFAHKSAAQGLDFDSLKQGDTVVVDIDDAAPKGARVTLMKPLSAETDEDGNEQAGPQA